MDDEEEKEDDDGGDEYGFSLPIVDGVITAMLAGLSVFL